MSIKDTPYFVQTPAISPKSAKKPVKKAEKAPKAQKKETLKDAFGAGPSGEYLPTPGW